MKMQVFRCFPQGAVLFLAVLLTVACVKNRSEVTVPRMETAEEQFNLAEEKYQQYRGMVPPEMRPRLERETIAAFEMVIQRYPENDRFTPLAKLRLAFMEKFRGETKAALKSFDRLIEEYPDNDLVQVYSIYNAGIICDDLKKFKKAKEYYRLALTPRFLNHPNEEIRNMANYCQTLARQIRSTE
ncbi:MAG: tetratricopeptide repeat protein [Candidatus Sumerlaeia bacterium]